MIRFWIISGICVATGLGIFYAEWVSGDDADPMTSVGVPDWLAGADRASPWGELHVVVAGLGVSGFAAADALQHLGAQVTVLADRADADSQEKATLLEILGVTVRLGEGATTQLPDATQLIVTSPGTAAVRTDLRPGRGARTSRSGVRPSWRGGCATRSIATPWLCLTGTNGKTTTVQMLDAMLRADGLKSVAAGNVGLPLCEVVMNPEPYDVVAVELSSHQLYWSDSLSAALRGGAQRRTRPPLVARRHAIATPRPRRRSTSTPSSRPSTTSRTRSTRTMVEEAEVVEGCRAIGFTHGNPRDRHGGGGRRRDRRPRFHRGTRAQRRRARARRPTSRRARRTTSRTRSPRPLSPDPSASTASSVRRGAPVVHPRPAPDRAGGRRRRGPVRRRLEGDQPTGGAGLTPLVRRRRLGRRWSGQGRDVRRGGAAGSRTAARSRAARRRSRT